MLFLLQDKDRTPKQVALEREQPFPFIIMEGTLDAPGEIHLAAEKQLLCTFRGSLIEATLGLLASHYVFMFNYPPSLNNMFLYLQKCVSQIHDGKKLPSSVITFVNEIDSLPRKASHQCICMSIYMCTTQIKLSLSFF